MVGIKLRTVFQRPVEVLIGTDASTKGWEAACNVISTGEMWSAQEMKNHINVLELLAMKLAIQTFSKTFKHKTIHLQVDNIVALTYLLKMGYPEFKISPIKKKIWDHLLQYGIALTAKYLPSKLNVTAGRESRNNSDSSEWKLSLRSFQIICQLTGTPEIDLFASRLSHQIKTYFPNRPDPLSQAGDALQQNYSTRVFMLFSHFA